MTHYTIKTGDNKYIDIVYFGKYVPILRSVLYEVHLAKSLSILDGERLWDREVHGMYFPLLEFRAEWDPAFYIDGQKFKSKECIAWLRFDLDFHIQRLIPHIPAAKYAHRVREGQTGLEHLVYKIGGVCPLALSRAGASRDLVRDAANLKHVTVATKRLRSSPWLGQQDCAPFMVEDPATMASFARLRDRGAIVKRVTEAGEVQIALAWAAKFDESKASCGKGEYVPFCEPGCDKGVPLRGDPSLRMDRCIDHHALPCTMWSRVTWNMPAQNVPVVHAVGRQQAIEIIKDEIQRAIEAGTASTYIVFSSQGRIGVDRTGSWTCCSRDGAIGRVQVCVRNPNALLVNGVETPKQEVFEKWECCDRRRWTDLAYMNISAGLDIIAGIFATKADMEWATRVCANTTAKKVLIQLVKKD